jgi:hypothetical protein
MSLGESGLIFPSSMIYFLSLDIVGAASNEHPATGGCQLASIKLGKTVVS